MCLHLNYGKCCFSSDRGINFECCMCYVQIVIRPPADVGCCTEMFQYHRMPSYKTILISEQNIFLIQPELRKTRKHELIPKVCKTFHEGGSGLEYCPFWTSSYRNVRIPMNSLLNPIYASIADKRVQPVRKNNYQCSLLWCYIFLWDWDRWRNTPLIWRLWMIRRSH
jgi:hypothetical protein